MKMTVKEFAMNEGIDIVVATSVVRFLYEKGLIQKTGEYAKKEGVRGRPSAIYDFPEEVVLKFNSDTTAGFDVVPFVEANEDDSVIVNDAEVESTVSEG